MTRLLPLLLCIAVRPLTSHAAEKTVYQCWQGASVSVATFKEPGSRCTPKTFEESPTAVSGVWKESGLYKGTLYSVEVDGKKETTTRELPGAKAIFNFTIRDNEGIKPPADPALMPRVAIGKPRLGVFDAHFKASAKRHKVDEAWLRAVAHVESGYSATAVSPKGAMGVMQLMPSTASNYAVKDPFSASQSIDAGARHMAYLLRLYQNDHTKAAAAYNAGVGAVSRHKGVPPYAETRAYVVKVNALYLAYKDALEKK